MYSYIAIICIGDRVRAKNKFLKLVGYFIRYSSIITDCHAVTPSVKVYTT